MSYTPTEWEPTDVVTATRMNALEQAVGDMNMSYTPNTWSDGDILSAEKMNALEQAVASGGGGGSSDFSTAEVTIVDNIGDGVDIVLPVIFEANEMGEGAPAMVYCVQQVWESGTYRVPLYKGSLVVEIPYQIATSGDILNLWGEIYSITGDCTITIS